MSNNWKHNAVSYIPKIRARVKGQIVLLPVQESKMRSFRHALGCLQTAATEVRKRRDQIIELVVFDHTEKHAYYTEDRFGVKQYTWQSVPYCSCPKSGDNGYPRHAVDCQCAQVEAAHFIKGRKEVSDPFDFTWCNSVISSFHGDVRRYYKDGKPIDEEAIRLLTNLQLVSLHANTYEFKWPTSLVKDYVHPFTE